ncbi:CRTAC1 family protein [Rubrivirga sp.]|uniref:CRTAC1 family protein n=1 Tax=Rubrivirga sp. TaxID=1885344 RepID=UPI003B525483
MRLSLLCLLAATALGGCTGDADTLFTSLTASETGLDFENRIEESQELNVFTYRNFFNGGGVGIGDVDGDGRPDVYLTANMGPNRLFLNRTEPGGPVRFQDVTEAAGVAGTKAWSTGVSVADVDGDGRLDLYVSNAGTASGEDRANELFRNLGPGPDGVPRFQDVAADWGVADDGTSTHGAFFDADADGDLDLYVLNNSFRAVSSFGLRNIRDERHPTGGDKLYRNEAGPGEPPRFVDVSEAAGILGSEIAFGLGVTLGDIDDDGLLDVFVSNDFFERDYLYRNRGDGTFEEVLEEAMPSISLSSMGADMTDLTGDGRPEVFVVDMLPDDDDRLKASSSYEGHNLYRAKVAQGYHHQAMRNVLQRNDGDGTFSEMAGIAGVDATDWSWAALFADLDLDARTDLFVTNGILRDVTDQDYIAFLADTQNQNAMATGRGVDFLELLEVMPSTPLENVAFRNVSVGDSVAFERAPGWGLNEAGFSNGAATADLDGDGDLDVIVNNVNAPASLYLNHAAERGGRSLVVTLDGEGRNTGGIGAKVAVWSGGEVQVREAVPTRGFQSSVDPRLHVGLGDAAGADSVVVRWPDGRTQTLADVPAGALTLRQAQATGGPRALARPLGDRGLLRDVTAEVAPDWRHREDPFVDYDRQLLMPWPRSTDGPAVAVGDVDGDGQDDLFLGGAAGQPGVLWLRRGGRFDLATPAAFDADAASEDVAAAFLDADGDGDLDLYVGSGGSQAEPSSPTLRDRLYLGDGAGGFEPAPDGAVPATTEAVGTVVAGDWDGDGDTDLFVGARVVPGAYGVAPRSALLRNDGRPGSPRLVDVTRGTAPGLDEVGMVAGAAFADWDGDGDLDLATAVEWGPITVWTNDGGRFAPSPIDGTDGLWQGLVAADLDGDGDPDLVGPNWGLNSRLRTEGGPLRLHVGDFDGNGRSDPLLSVVNRGRSLPFALRNELTAQLPGLKREYLTPSTYVGQTVEDLLTPAQLERADVYQASQLASAVLLNGAEGWSVRRLPFEAQLAPMAAALGLDADGDGATDLLMAGNRDGLKPDLGRQMSSRGALLLGDGRGGFRPVRSGFRVGGQVRHLVRVRGTAGDWVVAVRNDAAPVLFALGGEPVAAR